jgi:ATP-dependent Clp protease ATP-binding subunit ClpC
MAAVAERDRPGHNHLGTEHVLLTLLRDASGLAARALARSGVDAGQVREQVLVMLKA